MASVEHLNRIVRYALAKNCQDDYSNWDSHLAAIFRGIRCKVNARSGYSPYFLLFGISPSFPEVGDTVISEGHLDSRVIELDGLPGIRQSLERASRSTTIRKVFHIGDIVRTKHIQVRYHFVRDQIKNGEFVLKYCQRLGGPMLRDLRSRIGVHTIRIPGGCQNLGNSSLCGMEKF
jgi:hypothetical protein